jgi:peptide/nickel transport system ATP-binding protein
MLEVENFSITYNQVRPPLPAAMDINFRLSPGECLGLMGESGCGKTSLALGVMGLLGQAQVRGHVRFQGRELTAMKASHRRRYTWRRIAMVFQNGLEVFNPVIRLGEQMAEPLRAHLGMSSKAARAQVGRLLRRTGLDPRWQHGFAHQLSGGMRQRALIAMALCCEPDILIVDEPTTSLDPQSQREILDLLDELRRRQGFGMLLISHNLPAIERLTTRVLTLYAGRTVEQGFTADVLRSPRHPYTRGLLNASADLFPYKDLWGIRGAPPTPGTATGCAFAPRCCQADALCTRSRPELIRVGLERLVACHKGGIETVLKAVGIQKAYCRGSARIAALQGVNLTIRKGEVVALVGRSGSGKSTLAHILAHVVKPDAGEVRFCGRLASQFEASTMMGGLQIVFQDPGEAVSHRLSVLEAVREPLDIMQWRNRPERDRKAAAALSAMHLPTGSDFLGRACHALSGGQRQRVAVARALVTDPALLLADEITAMLDPSTQAVILRELKAQQHQRGFSMLFISHDIHLARKLADQVYVLDQGAVIERGAAFEVLQHGFGGMSI